MKEIFPQVYKIKGRIATRNSTPGFKVYGEKLIKRKGQEYRLWDPWRSKLAAGILKGLRDFPFSSQSKVLYLGASAGTTPSHLADIVKEIYCVEISERMMFSLFKICQKKKNMSPILEDANKPEKYFPLIPSGIDIIYQDLAQKNQAEILIKNAKMFSPHYALLVIKSRSISSVEKPKKITKEEIKQLKKKFKVLQIINLKPYHKDHLLISLKA